MADHFIAMDRGFLADIFSDKRGTAPDSSSTPLAGEIDKSFRPSQGTFFRTLEYPETNLQGEVTGKIWMEAGYDPETESWVLWQKTSREMDDPLTGGVSHVMSAKALFEKTDFVTAFDQMMTFETAQGSLGVEPLTNKTPAKLGGDYYKQFAWREGLMMSRSGRLYPMSADNIKAANYFNEQDIADAKAFLERLKTEQFVPVPIILPATDWAKAYEKNKDGTDQRLRALYYRYGGDRDDHELALQIVGQEAPEVLYAHIQNGFTPKIFENDPARHYALLKAAIDRPSVESLNLLSEAGVSFYARHNDETPLEAALKQRRYSHLHVMLSRDGATLANYRDENHNAPAVMAMQLQDRQAFRMLYLEGLDYSQADAAGWLLVHHAFENSFMPGVYAWLDEGLSIDEPIRGTALTALSIARRNKDEPLADFALKKGAGKDAPDFPQLTAPAATAPISAAPAVTAPAADAREKAETFSLDLLNSRATNTEIEAAATAYVQSGGTLDLIHKNGLSLWEICWKNRKPNPDLDRRALIPVFGKLGADPSATLDDGTTVLTRITSATALDMDFLKAIAPFAKDVNNPDAGGNNLLHLLQMNTNEAVAHSNNFKAIIKLFPDLDLNRQNNDGFSNIGLAIRLNRSQTLKNIPPSVMANFNQLTKSGWSPLDIAFTSAAGLESVTGAPRADQIKGTSEATRNAVLAIVDRAAKGSAEQKQNLSDAFSRQRPDGKTLLEAMAEEKVPAAVMTRLAATGLTPKL